MRRVLTYVSASPVRECSVYLVVSFALSWLVWIPVLLACRAHDQLGNLLIIGTFGPSVAAVMCSYRGARVPDAKLSSRIVCFSLTSLVCWAVLIGHAKLWDEVRLSLGAILLLLLPATVPAWIVSTAFSRDRGIRGMMRSLLTPRPIGWHAFALLLFPALLFVSAVATRVWSGTIHPPNVAGAGSSYAPLVIVEFGYAFFVGGGVSEEPGWRGFLLPRLQARFSPLVASLLVWFPWALWHAPLDLAGYAGSTFADYLRARVLVLLPLCIIITWVYNRCGGTILSAALFHSAFNVAPDFLPSTGLAVWVLSAVALVAIVVGRMWQKNVRVDAGDER
jgi:CAAX protease family protein